MSDGAHSDPESQTQDQETHSLPLTQKSPPRETFMEGVEPGFLHSKESFKDPQDLASEAEHKANLQEVLGFFSSSTPNVQQALRLILGFDGNSMI